MGTGTDVAMESAGEGKEHRFVTVRIDDPDLVREIDAAKVPANLLADSPDDYWSPPRRAPNRCKEF